MLTPWHIRADAGIRYLAWGLWLLIVVSGFVGWTSDCTFLPIQEHIADAQAYPESCYHQDYWWNSKFVTDVRFTDVLLAAFTGLLVWVGWVQAARLRDSIDLTRRSIELGNKEFIATHRPRLRVRRFLAHLVAERPVRVSFVVVNWGASRAHIRHFEIGFGIHTAEGLNFDPTIAPLELRTLEAGEATLFVAVAADLNYNDDWRITQNIPGPTFDVRGEIEYADDFGLFRRTGFWRIRDLSARMTKRADPQGDWEYED